MANDQNLNPTPETNPQTALEIAESIRSGQASAAEVMDDHLSRIDKINPDLNAICFRDDQRAREDAAAVDKAIASGNADQVGPFAGVPMLIKDLNDVDGWPTSFGSEAVSSEPATADTLPVGRLRGAGFVFSGKTNTPEFGAIPVTESQRLGQTRNPWNTDHTPGGSSGGAGASVAAGIVSAAHASDGGGSIRIPASCNGLVGLKASRHRVTSDAYTMGGVSTQGILTRTVADQAAILDVMAAEDPTSWVRAKPLQRPLRDEVNAPQAPLRIRLSMDNMMGSKPDPECVEAAESAAAALEELGHVVTTGPLAFPTANLLAAFLSTWAAITAGHPLDPERLEPHNKASRADAEATGSIAYAEGLIELQKATRAFLTQFTEEFDLALSPTMAIVPPKVGWLFESADEDPRAPMARATPMAAYTALYNITGQPAISLPVHTNDQGLPIGIQLAGRLHAEPTLIRVASQLEQHYNWADNWPG